LHPSSVKTSDGQSKTNWLRRQGASLSHVASLLETQRFQYFRHGKTTVFPTPFPFDPRPQERKIQNAREGRSEFLLRRQGSNLRPADYTCPTITNRSGLYHHPSVVGCEVLRSKNNFDLLPCGIVSTPSHPLHNAMAGLARCCPNRGPPNSPRFST